MGYCISWEPKSLEDNVWQWREDFTGRDRPDCSRRLEVRISRAARSWLLAGIGGS